MKKDPKAVRTGLLAWREYERALTDEEIAREIRKYGNEGLEFVCQRNSETVLMFCTNDGLAFNEKRLYALRLHWERTDKRFAQLRAHAAAKIDDIDSNRKFRTRTDGYMRIVRDAQSQGEQK